MKQNIFVDGQILQTNAWYRGMGKYTTQVLSQLSQHVTDDFQVSIVFNSRLECDASRYETIAFLCPNVKQLSYSLPVTSDEQIKAAEYKDQLSEHLSDERGKGSNYFLLTSLFSFDFFAEFPNSYQKLLLFYDLTPLLFWRDLGGYFPPELYMARFQKLFEADYVFCISETTRLDLLTHFGLAPSTLVNINGGFTKIADKTQKPINFSVPDRFILFPTGDLPHKNNKVAVKGFAQYCQRTQREATLLITSHFQQKSKERLRSISDKIIFTDNVSDEELEWLYEHADSILFASKYEGLGMPILDAVASRKPIITSQIAVFKEMSRNAFYYFDPTRPDSLADAFEDAYTKKDFNLKLKDYPKILQKYTWQNTAETIIKHLKLDRSNQQQDARQPKVSRPRLAVVCLHPGIPDQIGRVAEALHFSLSQKFQVEYYFDANGHHYRDMERPSFLDYIKTKSFEITKLTVNTYKQYNKVVYLLDEAALPSRAAQRACILPGSVVMNISLPLNKQAEMLKQIILKNNHKSHSLKKTSYESFQNLATDLYTEIMINPRVQSTVETIIRGSNSNSSIIKKLKVLANS